MKKKVTGILSITVVVMLMFSLFAGCGSSPSNGNGTTGQQQVQKSSQAAAQDSTKSVLQKEIEKPVEIKMYLPGEGGADLNMVLDKINGKLKQDINATLSVSYIGWSEYDTKYPLVLASGEDFDLIYTSNWSYFDSEAEKGSFMALNDLLPVYAPKIYNNFSKEAWGVVSKNGKILMMPGNYQVPLVYGVVARGDLLKKYNISDIKTLDDFGAYLGAVKKDNPQMLPYNAGGVDISQLPNWMALENRWVMVYPDSSLPMYVTANNPNIFFLWDTPEGKHYYELVRQWSQAGYWSKNVLSNKVQSKDTFLNGTSAATLQNLPTMDTYYGQVVKDNPSYDPQWFPIGPGKPAALTPVNADGMGINAHAAHPERALMMLDLFENDRDYYDLTFYGIKGIHYDTNDKGQLILPTGPNANSDGFTGMPAWGWFNSALIRESATGWPKFLDTYNTLKSTAYISKLDGFKLDITNIKAEIAALKEVYSKYIVPLNWGLVDVDKGLADVQKAMKDAGIDKVKAEAQQQMNEYFQAHGLSK